MRKVKANNPSRDRKTIAYESSDVSIGGLTTLVIGFVVLGVIIWVVVWKVMKDDATGSRLADKPNSAVVSDDSIFHAPPLQPTPRHDQTAWQDLASLRQNEDQVFEHLGWKRDPQTGEFTPPTALVNALAERKATNP